MRFVTARDLRNNSSKLWDQLDSEREFVITVNGRPVALITNVSEENLEETLKALRQAKAQLALSELQRASVAGGKSNMSAEEIEKEIKASRRRRKT
jgi:prevent-host-death family protein